MRRGRGLRDGVVVEAVEPAHGVGGDELARVGVGADDVDLVLLVARPGVGDEALPVEQQAGVSVGRRATGIWSKSS